jgi:23S rRNA pseudouridine1911/1915/1917 synthase
MGSSGERELDEGRAEFAADGDELGPDVDSPASEASAPLGAGELSSEPQEFLVTEAEAGKRLDALLAERFAYHSRMNLRRAIHAGGTRVDGRSVRSAFRVRPGQRVVVHLPPMPREGPIPEDIPLEILYEDEHLAAINKPPAMVVHPGRGHWKGTLTAALAHHFRSLSDVGGPVRPGVVHRLDRDTTGVIVVAKSNRAHFELAQQFEERVTEKEYMAIVVGAPEYDRDMIDLPIGIHPYQREKMAIRVNHESSKPAKTFYEVVERFSGFALVRAMPKTGRTHQIRVHLSHLGYPVLCDKQYGGRSRITRGELARDLSSDPLSEPPLLDRHALHAFRLTISHPMSGESLTFEAPLPADMTETLAALRQLRPRLRPAR